LYTSSEEHDLHYKHFIEDVVFGLKELGAIVIPDPSYLRANNNKVFMEILRQIIFPNEYQTISAYIFGTYDEILYSMSVGSIQFPCVIKKAAGGMSRGVYLAKNQDQLNKIIKKLSYTASLKIAFKEKVRQIKHKNYKPESLYQNKFIIQPFISNLHNDWKLLIFGDKYYIFERPTRKNDFRASGSGSMYYKYGSEATYPQGIFEFAHDIYSYLQVPHASLDIAFDGNKFYLFEFQAVYFGTVGQIKSDIYYLYDNNNWEIKSNDKKIEEVYADSIVRYINQNLEELQSVVD
jgi:glutathione synthase/RimK-type ligase-like ATP-grasp enzyme